MEGIMEENKENKQILKEICNKKPRNRISQTDIPLYTLKQALVVPKAILDNFAGRPIAPIQVALALNISPGSTNWRYLAGASTAYGLTNGGYNSKDISLTDLGKRIIAPLEEGKDITAIIEAVLKPTLLNKFYNSYNNAKFPKDNIAESVLVSMGVPIEKVKNVLGLVKDNGEFADIIADTKNGWFVFINPERVVASESDYSGQEEECKFEDDIMKEEPDEIIPDVVLQRMNIKKEENKIQPIQDYVKPLKQKVFISHGKNKKIVEQLKELLTFGQFEPVVSVERETTAIPVPEKVFSDMSECQAGIIHIEGEIKLLDEKGNEHHKINENVLIEIGAAIAYYKKKVTLLCQKGVVLPSNLQGLYRCEYEGEQLDYPATMKLLKTFNEFRN
ncbi:nucleotide-binding protein [Clostridium estertheticum]|uniref:TIR domain-containing protein n=1 Tax=Clostridium estertheticum TaxID=238834 RepID=UPI0013E99559|nr:TIR domain-containing protein [Clostridium estertheticum]MBZ9685210.1 nucleotide-binding protein [Clostridium estertheticum]